MMGYGLAVEFVIVHELCAQPFETTVDETGVAALLFGTYWQVLSLTHSVACALGVRHKTNSAPKKIVLTFWPRMTFRTHD